MVEEIPYDEIIDETCPSCRMTIPLGTSKCPHCGYQIREEAEVEKAAESKKVKVEQLMGSSNPTWFGGTLILVSGILGVLTGLYSLADPGTMVALYSDIGLALSNELVLLWGAISLIFGLVAIVGGVMALRRRSWSIAVAGGLLGTLASGAVFLGTILGLLGLVMVVSAKRFFWS